MNPHLPWFVEKAARLRRRLMVRSNLLILLEHEYGHFIDLYTDNRVEVVTSLPDYNAQRTDRQRGHGAFERIIRVMRDFNARGYGQPGSGSPS